MYKDANIQIVDEIIEDRWGRTFSIWYVYHAGRVISVEFTRGGCNSPSDRIELKEVV